MRSLKVKSASENRVVIGFVDPYADRVGHVNNLRERQFGVSRKDRLALNAIVLAVFEAGARGAGGEGGVGFRLERAEPASTRWSLSDQVGEGWSHFPRRNFFLRPAKIELAGYLAKGRRMPSVSGQQKKHIRRDEREDS
jgi:hypothetical protein